MDQHYENREQAYVKHVFLRNYLQSLAHKLGWYGATINYVDGFSGPWLSGDEELVDTSPHIALSQLERARENLVMENRAPRFRCLFIEKDSKSYARLKELQSRFPNIEVQTRHGEFEEFIRDIRSFVTTGGVKPFGFVFIDPMGWTGYGLSALSPLLELQRVEVLVNFMTSYIRRFIGVPQKKSSITALFGGEVHEQWSKLKGVDRDDAIVDKYCQRLRARGKFDFTGSSIVLDPHRDRSHYHLIFATRSIIGLQVYRAAEAKSLELQSIVRSQAQQRARIAKAGQTEMFDAATYPDTSYVEQLMDRYHRKARGHLFHRISKPAIIPYKTFAGELMSFPMVSEKHVKEWLRELRRTARVRIELPPGFQVPSLKPNRSDLIITTPS